VPSTRTFDTPREEVSEALVIEIELSITGTPPAAKARHPCHHHQQHDGYADLERTADHAEALDQINPPSLTRA